MRLPALLCLLTGLCLAAMFVFPALADGLPLGIGAAAAALWLLWQAMLRHLTGARLAELQHSGRRDVVVDGSNVMHWRDGTPQLATLVAVLRQLEALGFTPGVVFDANADHLLTGRYCDDAALARLTGLARDRVVVVDKGQPADPMILRVMREMAVPVVSNDRYRDWAAAWPEVQDPAHFIRGRWQGGTPVLWGPALTGATAGQAAAASPV